MRTIILTILLSYSFLQPQICVGNPDASFLLNSNILLNKQMQEHTTLTQFPISAREKNHIIELVLNGIDFYFTQNIAVTEKGVDPVKSYKKMMLDLKISVINSIDRDNITALREFEGYSEGIKSQVKEITELNWDKKKFTSDGDKSFDRLEIGKSYLLQKIAELKEMAQLEIEIYADENLRSNKKEAFAFVTEKKPIDTPKVHVDTTRESLISMVDEPIDFNIEKIDSAELPMFIAPDKVNGLHEKDFELQGEVADKIIALLESNNRLIEAFGQALVDLRQDFKNYQEENLIFKESVFRLEERILYLETAIQQISSNNANSSVFTETVPIENVEATTVFFGSGSTYIGPNSRLKLNRIFEYLVKNPNYKLMITGYADKTGSSIASIYVSEQRASAVRTFLTRRGISKDRMLINYFGDSESQGANASDRKAVIEILESRNLSSKLP